jgi:DNA polymerase-3 subunit delta'
MNLIAANALLKTLEEPPGATRLVLCSAAADLLLPTIRSRCQAVALGVPDEAVAARWLVEQGVAEPGAMLRACGGLPQDVLEAAALGIDGALWARVPALVARGDPSAFAGWPLPRLIESLQKLCHDAWCVSRGAPPRYFAAGSVMPAASIDALQAWSRALQTAARHDEHPWNAALLADSLIEQGRRALSATPARRPGPLHSAA